PGLICILHTWNQKLEYHPHVHCIIPAGGLNTKGEWKTTKGEADFLFNKMASWMEMRLVFSLTIKI
ncbi:MAG: transposase, partial [Flavobacteriales bacterium]|nr:transposase [Flavobacteriales bacterium]